MCEAVQFCGVSQALEGVDGRAAAGPARDETGRPLPLPCPPREQLNNEGVEFGAAKKLKVEVWGACLKFGVGHVGMLTLTFPDEVREIAEASRRFHSLMVNRLSKRCVQWAVVVQRHKDGRIHFHLVVVTREDIGSGLNLEALKRRDYRSANAALRAEWAWLREVLPGYGFGRHELLPVQDVNGFGDYLGRYLVREMGTRRPMDKGARLVRYSKNWDHVLVGRACWVDTREREALRRAKELGANLWGSFDRMLLEVGSRWRWKLARTLYCGSHRYLNVVSYAEKVLQYYGGPELILAEGHKAWDEYERKTEEEERKRNPLSDTRFKWTLTKTCIVNPDTVAKSPFDVRQ